MNENTVEVEVQEASNRWINAFNAGDIKQCAERYLETAVMNARPLGRFEGRDAIYTFWSEFVESTNAANLIYSDINVFAISETSARLSASWTMNVGRGIITEELWVNREGQWFLSYDDFTVEENYS